MEDEEMHDDVDKEIKSSSDSVRLLEVLANVPDDLKKAIYEGGRQQHMSTRKLRHKLWYEITRKPWVPIIGILLTIVGGLFVWNNWIYPTLEQVGSFLGFHKAATSDEWIDGRTRYNLITQEHPPTRDCITLIEAETMVKDSDGGLTKTTRKVWVKEDGTIKVKAKDYRAFKATPKYSRIDFRLQFGLGILVTPTAYIEDLAYSDGNAIDKVEQIVDPAIFLSPLEIYNRVSFDAFASHRRIGGGISAKIPTKYTTNTYIGAGIAVPYNNMVEKNFTIYAKINF